MHSHLDRDPRMVAKSTTSSGFGRFWCRSSENGGRRCRHVDEIGGMQRDVVV